MRIGLASIHRGLGDCPVTSGSGASSMCTIPTEPEPIPCSEISDCDSVTGAVHFEYMLPSGVASNPDETEVNPGTGLVLSTGSGSNLTPGEDISSLTINPATGQYWNPADLPSSPVAPTSTVSPAVPAPPVSAGGGVTASQISAAANLGPTNLTAVPVTTTSSVSDWLTATSFDSIPNWLLLAGGVALLFFLSRSK